MYLKKKSFLLNIILSSMYFFVLTAYIFSMYATNSKTIFIIYTKKKKVLNFNKYFNKYLINILINFNKYLFG